VAPQPRIRTLAAGALIGLALLGCSRDKHRDEALSVAIKTPSGQVVTTVGRRATARGPAGEVPGICGTQKSTGSSALRNEYCVYATRNQAASAGVVFLGSDEPDVLVVLAVPDDGMTVRFEPDHGQPRIGRVVAGPSSGSPDLGLLAIPRAALGGHVVIRGKDGSHRLTSTHLARDACAPLAGASRSCSIDLRFDAAAAPAVAQPTIRS
jgi:hypothetical protein